MCIRDSVKPTFNPANLVGRSHSYVGAQFGKADFNRTEGVIHVLQYQQADCVIDLFIKIVGTVGERLPENAKILGWAMRERTINKPLNQILCQQQFYERKLKFKHHSVQLIFCLNKQNCSIEQDEQSGLRALQI